MKSTSKVVVRYAETDRMGIVHHSVYPVWYEVARTDYIKKTGMTYSEMEDRGVGCPLVELGCKYMSPANYEDELTVEVGISKLTPVRVTFVYEIYNQNNKLINTGFTTHAWTGKDLKIVNLKKEFPDIYANLNKCLEED